MSIENVNPMLNLVNWESHSTIEHIWPQSGGDDWPYDLAELPNANVLGNLTLLPRSENSCAGDRSWKEKRLIYKVLSSTTPNHKQKLLEEAESIGLVISDSTVSLLNNARHLPQITALGAIESEFDKEIVDARSHCLASLVWKRVSGWVGLS